MLLRYTATHPLNLSQQQPMSELTRDSPQNLPLHPVISSSKHSIICSFSQTHQIVMKKTHNKRKLLNNKKKTKVDTQNKFVVKHFE